MLLKSLKIKPLKLLLPFLAIALFSCHTSKLLQQNNETVCKDFDNFVIQHWNYGKPDSIFMSSFYYNKWDAFDSCVLKLDTAHFQKIFGHGASSQTGRLTYFTRGRYENRILAVHYSQSGQIQYLLWEDIITDKVDVFPLRKYSTNILADSLKVISQVTEPPKPSVNLDSASKKIDYPQMERDNLIGGDGYATFTISETGTVDSVWLTKKISIGIDKQIIRFVKSLPAFIPAKQKGKNVSCICQIAFHFRVKE